MQSPPNPFGSGPPGHGSSLGHGTPPGHGSPHGAPPPHFAPRPPGGQNNAPVILALVGVGVLVLGGIVVGLAAFGAGRQGEVDAPASDPVPTPRPGAGAGAGGLSATCVRATNCCRKLMTKAKGTQSACDAMKNPHISDPICQQLFESYRDSAKSLGVTCN